MAKRPLADADRDEGLRIDGGVVRVGDSVEMLAAAR